MRYGLGILSMVLVSTLAACGSGDNGDPDGGNTCTEAASLCATVSVPTDFSGTPLQLQALGFDSLPASGMPTAFFSTLTDPDIGPGHPLALKLTGLTTTGTHYFVLSLLMEGGGTMSPVAGIDYTGAHPAPLTFDGTPFNLPDIELTLYQGAGGP